MEDLLTYDEIIEDSIVEEGVSGEPEREDNISTDSNIGTGKTSIKIDELEGGEKLDERESIDKSYTPVLISYGTNDLRSSKAISVDSFDSVNLWTNNNPSANFGQVTANLSDNLSNYDYMEILYYVSTSDKTVCRIVVNSDFWKEPGSPYSHSSFSFGFQSGSFTSRLVIQYSDTQLFFDVARISNSNNYYSDYIIPFEINGLKLKEVVGDDSGGGSSGTGNTIINNNYYGTVSDDSLSMNLINKPLNRYNPSESLAVISILICFGLLFGILIRKAVFKWR